MSILEIVLIGLGLSMDICAVSICKGLSIKKFTWKKAFIIAIYFSFFQAFFPFLGYLLGSAFETFVTRIDHWIAFFLLAYIGLNMVKSSFAKDGGKDVDDKTDFKTMLVLSLATNVDALTVGVTFAFFKTNMFVACSLLFLIGLVFCLAGVKIGNLFGDKLKNKAQLTGGIILILMGIKILVEHLGIF